MPLATAITLPAGTATVKGTITPGDHDLFRFALPLSQTLTLYLPMAGFNPNLLLFNGLGHGQAGDDDNDEGTLSQPTSLSLGYVGNESTGGLHAANSPYTLSFSVPVSGVSPVPEPSALAMGVVGLAWLAAMRRRKGGGRNRLADLSGAEWSVRQHRMA